jgi:hypothetical protein
MKMNTPIDYKNAKLILFRKAPHTFLNTIFINETEYNNREIEPLYTHELTHVTQNTRGYFIHRTIENLLVQPYFFFTKKPLQLNHEFLADEKVVNSYNNVPFYQSLLLSKSERTKLLLGQ